MAAILVNSTTCPFALMHDECHGCTIVSKCLVSPRYFKFLSIGQWLQISINTL